MKLYMALAPPWAQILAQPPPVPKVIVGEVTAIHQRTLEVSGQLGASK